MSTPLVPGPPSTAAAAARAERLSRAPAMTWARGQLAAWFLLSLVYLVSTAALAEAPAGGTSTRLLQYAYGTGHFFALGAIVAGVVFAWRRLRPNAAAVQGYLAAGAAAFVIGWPLLSADFLNLIGSVKHTLARRIVRVLLILAVAAALPLAAFVGRRLARAGLRPLSIVAGIACMTVSCFVAPQAYFGLHLFATVGAATLIGVSLAGVRPPELLAPLVTGRPRPVGPYTIALLWGAWSIVVAPPPPVLFELFRTPGAVLAPFVAPLHVRPPPVDEEALLSRWPALAAEPPPPAPPTAPPVLPDDGVVVLVTVDCFRADVLDDEALASTLPNLTALRDRSVAFTQARTTAASTVIALSSIFTGKHFSQLAWSDLQTRRGRRSLPHADDSVRFPELLSQAGVATVTYAPADWLASAGGIARGFREEEVLAQGADYVFSETLVDRAIRRIDEHRGGPMFLFLHLLDAHAPYDLAGEDGTPFERYHRELGLVDRQIGRLLDALKAKGMSDRAAVIVTADHGEAFGEHHTYFHKFTVYEELVRVPLLIRAPHVAPRTVADPVSLIDLGPTVLDLFGQAAPPGMEGQTLVPALRGERLPVLRPRAMESDLHQALVIDGTFKIARHKLRGTIELYDLSRDPQEKDNLFDHRDRVALERLGVLGAFFDRIGRK